MTPDRQRRIESALCEGVAEQRAVHGGCIADSRTLTTVSGKTYFLKQVRSGQDPKMLRAEANGLLELQKAEALRVPNVIAVDDDFLLLEHIDARRATEEHAPAGRYAELGRALAGLHRFHAETFGFYEDNFLGASPQANRASGPAATDWPTFYGEQRLDFQLRLADRGGYASAELRRGVTRLIEKLPSLLAGTAEPPTLLHGDLWAGNHLIDNAGEAWVIDPAVSYGHREADLAMTTLFGGYPPAFHSAYREALPLFPGWQEREPLYQLYHLLNHLNLFGRSYLGGALAVVHRYTG